MTTLAIIPAKHTAHTLSVFFGFGDHISEDANDVTCEVKGGEVLFHIFGYELATVSVSDYWATIHDINSMMV